MSKISDKTEKQMKYSDLPQLYRAHYRVDVHLLRVFDFLNELRTDQESLGFKLQSNFSKNGVDGDFHFVRV